MSYPKQQKDKGDMDMDMVDEFIIKYLMPVLGVFLIAVVIFSAYSMILLALEEEAETVKEIKEKSYYE